MKSKRLGNLLRVPEETAYRDKQVNWPLPILDPCAVHPRTAPRGAALGCPVGCRVWLGREDSSVSADPHNVLWSKQLGAVPPSLECLWGQSKGQGHIMWQGTWRSTSEVGIFLSGALHRDESLRKRLRTEGPLRHPWDCARLGQEAALGPSVRPTGWRVCLHHP